MASDVKGWCWARCVTVVGVCGAWCAPPTAHMLQHVSLNLPKYKVGGAKKKCLTIFSGSTLLIIRIILSHMPKWVPKVLGSARSFLQLPFFVTQEKMEAGSELAFLGRGACDLPDFDLSANFVSGWGSWC